MGCWRGEPGRARGLTLSHRCCTMYVPSTRMVSKRTSFDRPRDHGLSEPDSPPVAAERGRTPGRVVGAGPVEGRGVAFFAIWWRDPADGQRGGSPRPGVFLSAGSGGLIPGVLHPAHQPRHGSFLGRCLPARGARVP